MVAMAEVKEAVSPREVAGADIIFKPGSEISTIGGPVTRGVVDQELYANRHFEPGAKRQKVSGGLKMWRSLNPVRLKGTAAEIDFEAGRLFGANPLKIETPQYIAHKTFNESAPEDHYVKNQYATKDN